MSRLATTAYCANVGGVSSGSRKLATQSELSTYGCQLVSSPSHQYSGSQCVRRDDIEASTPIVFLPIIASISDSSTASSVTINFKIDTTSASDIPASTVQAEVEDGDAYSVVVYDNNNRQVQFVKTDPSTPESAPYFYFAQGDVLNNVSGANLSRTVDAPTITYEPPYHFAGPVTIKSFTFEMGYFVCNGTNNRYLI